MGFPHAEDHARRIARISFFQIENRATWDSLSARKCDIAALRAANDFGVA
jgi:hypothetical protein